MAGGGGSDSRAVEYLDARPLIEVEDIAAALEFFTGIAGMDIEETLGDPVMFAMLKTGGARFAVVENEEPAIPAGRRCTSRWSGSTSSSIVPSAPA